MRGLETYLWQVKILYINVVTQICHRSRTVVEHMTRKPKSKGSNPPCTERENVALKELPRMRPKGPVGGNQPIYHLVFPTDIRFCLASWYYANSLRMSVYGCSQMLDGLVSSHPQRVSRDES
jgi:hypothetical protein